MPPNSSSRVNLPELRAKIASATGPRYWRSLDELAETEEFQELLKREFPEQATDLATPAGRRSFPRLMGTSLALAGFGGCTRQPAETIVPYARSPELMIPGKSRYFASALSFGGYGQGVLVESHYGRPTKIAGNPEHPASLGATDIFAQDSVLTLYDPDRSQVVTHLGEISRWTTFVGQARSTVRAAVTTILLVLLRGDGGTRSAHGGRAETADMARLQGTKEPLPTGLLRAGRDGRAVLALRGHRLEFSLSAAVLVGATLMAEHVSSLKSYLRSSLR